MKILNKFIILILSVIFIFLNGCQGIKDNLSMKKKANSDEFLVKKKNPLILPPDYQDLPKPLSEENNIKNEEDKEINFSKIFNNSKEVNSKSNSDINQSLENSIRKKIGNN